MGGVWIWMLLMAMVAGNHAAVFDVKSYGAKADGKADDSKAILDAWKAACNAGDASTVTIPKGTYMVGSMKIEGPCKAPITIEANKARFVAPIDPNQLRSHNGWINFIGIDKFVLQGGRFDGQGELAWHQNNCAGTGKCGSMPINLSFNTVTNALIHSITSYDSKQYHMDVLGCKNVTFRSIRVSAPDQSLNTDGIHIVRSSGINVTEADIKTGDDCVSVGDGSQQVNIEKVKCGPGHGIVIGSLGKYNNEEPVVGVTVKNCTLTNTVHGVRVETWPASPSDGIARDLHFQNIIMNNVGTPVSIDQEYCPYKCDKKLRLKIKANDLTISFSRRELGFLKRVLVFLDFDKVPSRVKISDVTFDDIRGTSASKVAVKLRCSSGSPCENVGLSNINLAYKGSDGAATSECANVKPKLTGQLVPPACQLSSA
ncbi:UNVERIFIED_CONTAM: Exopolygalacturonase [Sesamum radiatum]|uniref:Exopolygalacturonase n=1 Tax=Sesamum radiatum TaxID=300843 RepID=A0AAW2SJ57_SESRA